MNASSLKTATPEPSTANAASQHKNMVFLIIDSLRWDTVNDLDKARALWPHLARLVERGWTRRIVVNASATMFVMPAVFSQSYPLDHGGYNFGVRDRPASFVEMLQKAGYDTTQFLTCNQLGAGSGYERGFNQIFQQITTLARHGARRADDG